MNDIILSWMGTIQNQWWPIILHLIGYSVASRTEIQLQVRESLVGICVLNPLCKKNIIVLNLKREAVRVYRLECGPQTGGSLDGVIGSTG